MTGGRSIARSHPKGRLGDLIADQSADRRPAIVQLAEDLSGPASDLADGIDAVHRAEHTLGCARLSRPSHATCQSGLCSEIFAAGIALGRAHRWQCYSAGAHGDPRLADGRWRPSAERDRFPHVPRRVRSRILLSAPLRTPRARAIACPGSRGAGRGSCPRPPRSPAAPSSRLRARTAPPTRRGVWGSLGEPGVGGRVTGLAVSPVDPGRLLVAGDMLGVGLSVDGGRSWLSTSGFSSWEMNALTWDVSDPSRVWVGSLSGPYESVDGGRSWVSMRAGMPTGDYPYSAPVQKVLIDAGDDQHLLAFGGNQRQFVAAGTGALNFGLVYESLMVGGVGRRFPMSGPTSIFLMRSGRMICRRCMSRRGAMGC